MEYKKDNNVAGPGLGAAEISQNHQIQVCLHPLPNH